MGPYKPLGNWVEFRLSPMEMAWGFEVYVETSPEERCAFPGKDWGILQNFDKHISTNGEVLKTFNWVVATQTFFIFTPKIGEDFQFDEHIFQRGWFNHQLVKVLERDRKRELW